ncbi:double-strand break repair protein AddB [Altererythrobacter sp. TH136]|uniref:double-strand break repair protein AddB n=1 Tax=Altererythrobacter sp. TH136 TaxID=2067415 RepID=UPI00116531AA|nr:double-strand break repair protein AddB [Altererythrobacter sp. TH136]QDM40168.1 double-strand break repair protein AddB [Altererythrobacter sp. TH136]
MKGPQVYSIAAHRGFADALVAGLIPRYTEGDYGLARLTLLLPSSRAARTLQEAFVRVSPSAGSGAGLLMPRMAVVGDLDLDETLGTLLDPLGAADIPPAVDPTRRWLRIAALLADEMGQEAPRGAALLRLAQQVARTMDRLLIEDIGPELLLSDQVREIVGDMAEHWQRSVRLFARVQTRWLAELSAMCALDASARRNRLFDHAARTWKERPPQTPVIAAGVTSAAPALARLLRVVSELPQGAVILPDLDLAMPDEVWAELGIAGGPEDPPFSEDDAVSHPQYHLKLLLNRMGVNRQEVQPWHRRGLSAAPPERSRAISSLFLPPEASKSWADMPPDRRRLAGVRLMENPNPEAEAQAIALLIRQAVAEPEKRVALVTPDRALARRVIQHLRRWNLDADDSAGRPLGSTAAGRLFLQLAQIASEGGAPIALVAALAHPLVMTGERRAPWLERLRAFELKLRGPRPAPGFAALRPIAEKARVGHWWLEVEAILTPLMADETLSLAEWLDRLAATGEALSGEVLWSREDGRALSAFVEDLRAHARETGTVLEARDLHPALGDAMEAVAVRPPYGGHPRVAIYGLIESRMARADLVIAAGLNEGTWPTRPATDPLLAPAVLRALGVPGADFRIGLNAHDLAAAMGAPEVVLSRSRRDEGGPAIASRFLLRVQALLGELGDHHREADAPRLAAMIDHAAPAPDYPRPRPMPTAEQRKVAISVTGLDRLRADPYQFYASSILGLPELEPLEAEPSPAWQGTLAHEILENWHKTGRPLDEIARETLSAMHAHPLTRALWRPRLLNALRWVEASVASDPSRTPVLWEEKGRMEWRGVTLHGRIDRLDQLEDGTFAVVDYKTGKPPSGAQVERGFALQLGTLGLMVGEGAFAKAQGTASRFEYWSLGRSDKSDTGFGYITTPILEGAKKKGIAAGEFLPQARRYLDDALDNWILGSEPFTARLNPDAPSYATYDQLMRLDEWVGHEQ